MKNYLIIIILITIVLCCKTTNISKIDNNSKIEREHNFDFINFTFNIDPEKSVINSNGLYQITYNFNFNFKNQDNNFTISYELADEENKTIVKGTNERAYFAGNYSYILNKKYKSLFLKNKFIYNITVKIHNEEKSYSGLYINENLPDLLLIEIGPIITSYIANKNQVNINTKLTINNCSDVKWIHLIPPSMNYYWEIPYIIENNTVNAGGLISDNDKSYISNGNYILQINFGKFGVIQKDIEIIDIYYNIKGKNYGMPLNSFITDDNEKITIKPEILSKIDYIEIWFYTQIGGNYQKLGINKIYKPNETILKKELRSNIFSDDNRQIKLKDNTEYFYRIYVYTVKFNNIYYQSMSELKPIEFKKFKYFIF